MSNAECIHGLDVPLCDSCYPKAPPEVVAPVRRATVTRRAGDRSTKSAPVATSRISIDPAQQRVYHVTHIRNLEAILDAGAILAAGTPVVDVSTDLTRELRSTAEVTPERTVAEYVPFYLTPSASLWEDLRSGAVDETRWSSAARASASVDFVVLVSTVTGLGDETIIADGDAAASFTRFASADGITRALTRLHDTEELDAAEVLAFGAVPIEAIQLIGVANDRVRDKVRELTAVKVAVYPPWFLPTEPA